MNDEVISRILETSQQFNSDDSGENDFLKSALKTIDASDLERADSAVLLADLRNTYQRLQEIDTTKLKLWVTPPAGAGAPLVLDIISPDMPYIVDSVLAAVRSGGGNVRLFAHPIVRPQSAAERQVSVLHIQADPVADQSALIEEIAQTLRDVHSAVTDLSPMLSAVRAATQAIPETMAGAAEAKAFVEWLTHYNFIFVGVKDFRLVGDELIEADGPGLGLFHEPNFKVVRSGADYVHSTPELVGFAKSDEPILVTKANLRSRIHRRAHLDYIGIKRYGPSGEPIGELRVVGLYTAQAQSAAHTDVPIIRQKIAEVMQRSAIDPLAHAGRMLLSALNSYPRDELFQVSTEQLTEFAEAIAALYDRPRVRVLPRVDRFDNFVSILVYVPRDLYDGDLRSQITQFLAQEYDGRVSAFYPHFLENELVRLHVIIGRNGGPTPRPERQRLEHAIEALTHNFGDRLADAASDPAHISDWRNAFTTAYQSRTSVEDALEDIGVFNQLGEDIAVRLRTRAESDGSLGLKFYKKGQPIPLSDRVPMLEHFGFRVIDERSYTITPRDGEVRYLHDMLLEVGDDARSDIAQVARDIEAGILAVWHKDAESDQLNTLITTTPLTWSQVALLRAFSRYLRQVGTPFSQRYIAQVLVTQKEAACALIDLFAALHDPSQNDPTRAAEDARSRLSILRGQTSSLDEDTILARFQNLMEASLRTNAYQVDRPALAIKFESAKIEGLAEPKPYREISVYSPRVEGIHMRFGAIARGGLRWSDRPEDYRTEVLGLVKAQQVKNAVIVPVGAKGGFVPKHLTAGMAREDFLKEGTESYKIFIGSLLDVTDNLIEGEVVPPQSLVRRDGDDPYLVVAADKGTASFSDLANSIAISRGFWLGDAFASGGSAGYDHKKMAITARGGWEAVKRHFREMGHDTQSEPFIVAGVGDMSGDVFGNGMLLSEHIRLVAAFDHRDIFLDPNPNEVTSFAERKRLFALPRSSWQDYDKGLISDGGGVYSRAAKTIPLSPAMQERLGLLKTEATPAEVMRAILRAPVDLLWFGGIGTYIKAASEDDAQVGDRANDGIRVAAETVRAKVVGEGANLGVTQLGRIAFAMGGGRINTDAIDNSAGVNSSDLEVNIKIALSPVVAQGALDAESRVQFLASMTDEVAQLCLDNNYRQTLALTQSEQAGIGELAAHRGLIAFLEAEGRLNRPVEFLPSDEALDARARDGKGLTRPELAVLLAYAKLSLFDHLIDGPAPDHAYLAKELNRYFPTALNERFGEAVENHQLKREVVATVLANEMINFGGPSFVSDLSAATSATAADAALAYIAVRDSFGLEALIAAIDGLDGRVSSAVQLTLYDQIRDLLRRETLWFIRNTELSGDFASIVETYRQGVETLLAEGHLLTSSQRDDLNARVSALTQNGVPSELAQRIAELPIMAHATDIALVANRSNTSITKAAKAYFSVAGQFELFGLMAEGKAIELSDPFERIALDRAQANLMRALRDLTTDALAAGSFETLLALRGDSISKASQAISRLRESALSVSKLSVAAGLLADLAQEA
ncbi:NAD-glutamate dehydrogenase [Devosia sp. MC521]|uniref:NAD-glutamate dehydrogenase n=1 Tax=Devosia sp. MC521 TaxID=2759954 RepID=UPI0015F7F4D3|nr:NAD-glutamate dehydrogenase [Devosia sp. MC521]MBJ6987364.1 NAD-glutamate dehydrogenase [Devosia sp. MC521]QMW63538.1 NAD-glutamate dehydrogenase [Devosia sp. MC521]